MTGALTARIRVQRGGFGLDLALDVPSGGVLALLGRNGAGKSTALAAIAGLVPLESGRIELDGVVLDDPEHPRFVLPERRPIGTVLQQPALFPHLTVLDNVAFGLRTGGLDRGTARAAAGRLLADAGLADLARRRPSQVSGGQAARVALVRTLARRPALLLLDEPLAAIDAAGRPALRAALRSALGSFEGSAVLVTHEVRDVEALAETVVVVDGGRVVQRGTHPELRAHPATDAVARLVSGTDADQISMDSSG
jgi:molybdate transport system ATP-binding protein